MSASESVWVMSSEGLAMLRFTVTTIEKGKPRQKTLMLMMYEYDTDVTESTEH